jgi:hypothetical protein
VRQSALRCPYFRWAGSMYATCPYRNAPNAPLDAGPRTISPSYEFILPRACLLGTCACVWPRGSFERERERVTLELAWASRLLRWHIAPYGRQLFTPKQYRRCTKLRLTASGRYMLTRLHRCHRPGVTESETAAAYTPLISVPRMLVRVPRRRQPSPRTVYESADSLTPLMPLGTVRYRESCN